MSLFHRLAQTICIIAFSNAVAPLEMTSAAHSQDAGCTMSPIKPGNSTDLSDANFRRLNGCIQQLSTRLGELQGEVRELRRALAALQPPQSYNFFYDVVSATRQRIAAGLSSAQYWRGNMETGQVQAFPLKLQPGTCQKYLIIAERPSVLAIAWPNHPSVRVSETGREPHMSTGRICYGKGDIGEADFELSVKMVYKGSTGAIVAESYYTP
jgi:hypothetical protein